MTPAATLSTSTPSCTRSRPTSCPTSTASTMSLPWSTRAKPKLASCCGPSRSTRWRPPPAPAAASPRRRRSSIPSLSPAWCSAASTADRRCVLGVDVPVYGRDPPREWALLRDQLRHDVEGLGLDGGQHHGRHRRLRPRLDELGDALLRAAQGDLVDEL